MSLLRNITSGLRSLFRKDQVDRELDEELGAYLEMEAAEKMKQGMSRKEAVRAVRLERGNVEVARETIRSASWESVLETCWQDLRFSGRMLRKSLGFTSVAVLVMALGIGANAAMFSVVNAVLLRPLSFNEPERIVTLASLWAKSEHGPVSAPDFRDWHDQSTAFEAMAYYQDRDTAITAGTLAEYGQVAMVSREFFQVFHVQPAIGREFNADETKPASGGAAMVSCDFAVSHYGNPNNALGQKIHMFDGTLDVVGVLPPGFHFPNKTDIWFPANTIFRDNENRGGHNYLVVGKLKPGVTLEQAQAQMAAIGARLEAKYPDSNTNERHGGQLPPYALGDAGRRRRCAADRVRESRGHAAGQGRGTQQRNSGSGSSRRGPRPHHAPAHYRKPRPGLALRGDRSTPGSVGRTRPRHASSHRYSPAFGNVGRRPRACIYFCRCCGAWI
jgi:hypothetical protein